MILTVCPNPCIDYTLYVDNFSAGKLNRVNKKVESLGGKGINVARAVRRLGYESYCTGFMYKDGAKKYFDILDAEGVPYIFAMCDGAVRINTKIISLPDMALTEINERGTPVEYQKQFELIESVRMLSENAAIAVLSGSVPPNVDSDFYQKVAGALAKNCKFIADCEGEMLLPALKLKPALVKPNLSELENIWGGRIKGIDEALKAADFLIEKGAQSVLVSMGREGALIYDGREAYHGVAPAVEARSTVGAGDCMVAASAVALSMGFCMEALLKSAIAAGTAAVFGEGTGQLTRENYDKIFPLVETRKIR